jgi:hypothetical protein
VLPDILVLHPALALGPAHRPPAPRPGACRPPQVCAKGIASGYPLACVAARSDLTATSYPNAFGGTYGGNAVACAAARATIEVRRPGRLSWFVPRPPRPLWSAARPVPGLCRGAWVYAALDRLTLVDARPR